jgi:multidrug efflux pump
MNALIAAAFSRSRVVVMALVGILVMGINAYSIIPKEANPEVPVPIFYVSTGLDGISPEDAERLLLEPLETEFASIAGLESLKSDAAEGFASLQLEFAPGGDNDEALQLVRDAVDRAEGDLPADAYDVTIT